MASLLLRGFAATAAFLLLGSIPVPAADAEPAAPATGDLWEVTSQMSMDGVNMTMPAQKTKVCAPKEWNEPPGGADDRMKCANSDFRREEARATWKTVCAGPPEMTGDGEITLDGSDAYSGTIKFNSSQGGMTLKLSGRRLGDCTPPTK